MSTGSNPGRITPAEGDAFFTSAMIRIPSRANAFAETPGRGHPFHRQPQFAFGTRRFRLGDLLPLPRDDGVEDRQFGKTPFFCGNEPVRGMPSSIGYSKQPR